MTDLRVEVESRLDDLETILARAGLISKVRGVWDELLHPRGRDGKFIEKNGYVNGTFQVADGSGRPVSLEGNNRVKVTGFTKNPANPDDPFVNVELTNGTPAQGLASQVQTAAPLKGRLNEGEGVGIGLDEVGPREVPAPPPAPPAPDPTPFDPPASQVVDKRGVVMNPDDQRQTLRQRVHGLANTAYESQMAGREGRGLRLAADIPEDEVLETTPAEAAVDEQAAIDFDEPSEFDDSPSDSMGDFNPPDPNKQTLTPADIAKVQKGPGEPVETDDIEEALELLARGEKVKLSSERQVSVLLDRMLEVYEDAKAKGEEAPNYNLCNVTVTGTNLFCTESKNINRIHMPQLKGIPLPGTPAAQMTPDSRGEVDLSDDFRAYLEGKGVGITDDDWQASHLKATQDELNGSKTAGIGRAIESGNYDEARIFISRDGYIVDGHHRWSATLGVDLADGQAGDLYMPVAVIDMDILDILAEANDFSVSNGIPQADVGEPTPWQVTDLQAAEKIDYDSLTPEQRDLYAAARRAKKTHEQAMAAA